MSDTQPPARDALLGILAERSFQYDESAPFKLASGRQSDIYVDCKPTTMFAESMELVGETVFARVPEEAQAIGGLTMGADPIASAVVLVAKLKHGRRINAFVVRKEAKKHGLRRVIEGCADAGTRVVVVDDVVTTGGSTIDAIRRCREANLDVVAVIVLVDREEGGLDEIRREAGTGVPVSAIFTRTDLQRYASEHGLIHPAGPRAASG